VPGTSRQIAPSRLLPTPRERKALWNRVGAFLRKRREDLGLSQGDIIKSLGYSGRNTVSNLETGREGLPAKRIYAWADILEVPRGAFFRFVTGEVDRLVKAPDEADELSPREADLVAAYRRLPPKFQRRLLETAEELQTLSRAQSRRRRGT
jgi:transcriptional regulator with XRE-family HTH domain